ncbi:NAD(P)-dependent oxidoreductase [Actinoplanes sp. TBRC 11911]|uniref:NAD(P)-dependent oxidoreductase n=1 Tax=Actinoplanes sp. TBRC 11911 TaxID=2729386 RepID=UPI00145E05ED|nr:NAD(P)-dependent oxidoreductase [Actinoplanes sp. TBRC 11911]NMO56214.1 NAD(P)-dependent oxidoreductase [Actinoplanes sp. TBRC 11911]
MEKRLRVGFVGLGDMGEPLARRLIQAGFPVTLWARREASLAPFAGTPYRRAADLVELGRASDVVGVCVFAAKDVREVILGDDGILGGMAPGGIILVHSTVTVEAVLDLQRECLTKGVTVLDAPVSGARQRAEEGRLTVMVGGPATVFEAVRPVLDAFGSNVEHLGPTGSGLRMKALNQALLFANLNMAALALDASRRLGLDRAATEATLRSSTGDSFGLGLMVGRMLPDRDFGELVMRIGDKDLDVFDRVREPIEADTAELAGIAREANENFARYRNVLDGINKRAA